jgi:hypothetical protein
MPCEVAAAEDADRVDAFGDIQAELGQERVYPSLWLRKISDASLPQSEIDLIEAEFANMALNSSNIGDSSRADLAERLELLATLVRLEQGAVDLKSVVDGHGSGEEMLLSMQRLLLGAPVSGAGRRQGGPEMTERQRQEQRERERELHRQHESATQVFFQQNSVPRNGGVENGVRFAVCQCPNCYVQVQRTQGCNTMVCQCGTTFCYGCGRRSCACNRR